jgi:hypothetical protein
LYYVASDGKLMSVPVKTERGFDYGAPVPLFGAPIADYPGTVGYVVTGDGQRFLIRTPADDANSPSVKVVTNWLAALKE